MDAAKEPENSHKEPARARPKREVIVKGIPYNVKDENPGDLLRHIFCYWDYPTREAFERDVSRHKELARMLNRYDYVPLVLSPPEDWEGDHDGAGDDATERETDRAEKRRRKRIIALWRSVRQEADGRLEQGS